MAQTNINILHGYFEEVINQKHLDRLPTYFSKNFTEHGFPYVGLGLMIDDTSGDKITIMQVVPGSPSDGKLMPGDEILLAYDGDNTWKTYDDLRQGGVWGQGEVGTCLTVRVRRDNTEHEIDIIRGLIKGMEGHYDMLEMGMGQYFKEYSDLKTRLVNVIESGDLVAYQLETQGFNTRYGRSAVWSEFGFARIQDGKITEMWNSEESISMLKQLGYTLTAPAYVKV
jgi:hypothetical protein